MEVFAEVAAGNRKGWVRVERSKRRWQTAPFVWRSLVGTGVTRHKSITHNSSAWKIFGRIPIKRVIFFK